MKSRYILYFLILTVFIQKSLAQSQKNTLLKIDSFLNEEYPENRPGAAILIAQDGNTIYKEAFGLANLKKNRPLETDMIFQIGSMTKQFTSAAILQLIEQNKLSLDDKIQKYVEYFPQKEYEITIEHLLSQTSGIPEFFDVDENEFYLLSQEHTPKQLVEYYADMPLLFEPGTKFKYSNSNYPLLGVVIEEVSGLTLKEYFDKNIFEPLGMKSTSLWYTKDFNKKQIPNGYRTKDGKLVLSPKIVGSTVYAAGGIVSTVDDLLIWNRALKNRTLLSDSIISLLFTEKTTMDGKGTNYGFGFFISELQGRKTIQHGGDLYGFTSSGLYLPGEDLFVCILANKSRERTGQVADYLASLVIGAPIDVLGKSALAYEEKKKYLGTYQMKGDEAKTIEIKLDEDLMILSFPDAPGTEVEIVSVEGATFKSVKANIEITFTQDANGDIVGFTGKQKDTFEWVKIK